MTTLSATLNTIALVAVLHLVRLLCVIETVLHFSLSVTFCVSLFYVTAQVVFFQQPFFTPCSLCSFHCILPRWYRCTSNHCYALGFFHDYRKSFASVGWFSVLLDFHLNAFWADFLNWVVCVCATNWPGLVDNSIHVFLKTQVSSYFSTFLWTFSGVKAHNFDCTLKYKLTLVLTVSGVGYNFNSF